MLGFTFNNKHSNKFDLALITKNIPILAKKRITEEEVLGRNSTYKFENGYDDKIIKLQCTLMEQDFVLRRLKIRDIVEWLSGSGKLILDSDPDKFYRAKLYNAIDTNITAATDTFILSFVCYPFAFSTYINEYVVMNSNVVMYSNMPVGIDLQNNFYVTGHKNGTLVNAGTTDANVVIEIDGTADSITIDNITGGFTIQNITEKTYINTEKMICYTLNAYGKKINKIIDFTGNFITIPKGESQITIDGTNLNCNVFFNYRNTFL